MDNTHIPFSGNFLAGENLRELLEVQSSLSKLSRIAGNNNDAPVDNDAAVLNENLGGQNFLKLPQNCKMP